uniref:Uncharacterized protein n=1 Tax=Megaselia scalaris TaxID=36166 RepID=T1H0D6_MEGSC
MGNTRTHPWLKFFESSHLYAKDFRKLHRLSTQTTKFRMSSRYRKLTWKGFPRTLTQKPLFKDTTHLFFVF